MSDNVFQLADAAVRAAKVEPSMPNAADAVFRVMHGFYGQLWLSKFATGQASPHPEGADKLATVVNGAKAGKKAIVSGYVDSSGSAAANAEIAPRDFMEAPSLKDRGGIVRARQVLGEGLNEMLDELVEALVA